MGDGPYRAGNHSPINVWHDPDGEYASSEQVCMATSAEWADRIVDALNARPMSGSEGRRRPRVVCLSGSMRFFDQILTVAAEETAASAVVLAPFSVVLPEDQGSELKRMLDTLHLRKIDMSDEVVVVTVDGYIGESTRREIEYAENAGKPLLYREFRSVEPLSVVDSELRDRLARAMFEDARANGVNPFSLTWDDELRAELEAVRARARLAEDERDKANRQNESLARRLHLRFQNEQKLSAELEELNANAIVLTDALHRLGGLIATDSRDWAVDRGDAWIYGLFCGWECDEEHVHDKDCDATPSLANRHGWSVYDVRRLRRYRAAIAAVQNGGRPDTEATEQAHDPVDKIIYRAVVRCADMDDVSVDTCSADQLDRYRDYVTATLAELPMDILGQLSQKRVEVTEQARRDPLLPSEQWCDRCDDYVSGSHWHCGKCGQRSSMMGHQGKCPPAAESAPREPRAWRHGADDNPDRPDPRTEQGMTVRNKTGHRWRLYGSQFRKNRNAVRWGFWGLLEAQGELTEVIEGGPVVATPDAGSGTRP